MNVHFFTSALSAIVWYAGGLVLCGKGASLLREAAQLRPELFWHWLTPLAGLLLGIVKAKFIFTRFCRENLARIAGLRAPKPWHCFRTRFFFLLALMIAAGVALSRAAGGQYLPLLGVATLDFAIAAALLLSSAVFWERR